MRDELSTEIPEEARKAKVMQQAKEDAETFRLAMIESHKDEDPAADISPKELEAINRSLRDKILSIIKTGTIRDLKITEPAELNLYNDSLEHYLTTTPEAASKKPKFLVN